MFDCRKGIWRQLKSAAVAETKELFTSVQSSDACTCLQARALGVTRIRYLPKKTGRAQTSKDAEFLMQRPVGMAQHWGCISLQAIGQLFQAVSREQKARRLEAFMPGRPNFNSV